MLVSSVSVSSVRVVVDLAVVWCRFEDMGLRVLCLGLRRIHGRRQRGELQATPSDGA